MWGLLSLFNELSVHFFQPQSIFSYLHYSYFFCTDIFNLKERRVFRQAYLHFAIIEQVPKFRLTLSRKVYEVANDVPFHFFRLLLADVIPS